MRNRKWLPALIVALTPLGASAQNFYAGGGLGVGVISRDNLALDFTAADIGINLYAGYDTGGWLSWEASYYNFGKIEDNSGGVDATVELSGIAVHAIYSRDVGDDFTVFGKFGLTYWGNDTTVSGNGFTTSATDDRTDIAAGFGATFAPTKRFTYRAQWDWYDVDNLDSAWLLSIGISRAFGGDDK